MRTQPMPMAQATYTFPDTAMASVKKFRPAFDQAWLAKAALMNGIPATPYNTARDAVRRANAVTAEMGTFHLRALWFLISEATAGAALSHGKTNANMTGMM